jgi:hypothetical protein
VIPGDTILNEEGLTVYMGYKLILKNGRYVAEHLYWKANGSGGIFQTTVIK